eukprot:237626-Amphidinium_carterae.1
MRHLAAAESGVCRKKYLRRIYTSVSVELYAHHADRNVAAVCIIVRLKPEGASQVLRPSQRAKRVRLIWLRCDPTETGDTQLLLGKNASMEVFRLRSIPCGTCNNFRRCNSSASVLTKLDSMTATTRSIVLACTAPGAFL